MVFKKILKPDDNASHSDDRQPRRDDPAGNSANSPYREFARDRREGAQNSQRDNYGNRERNQDGTGERRSYGQRGEGRNYNSSGRSNPRNYNQSNDNRAPGQRRSYNPNFTSDNKLRDSDGNVDGNRYYSENRNQGERRNEGRGGYSSDRRHNNRNGDNQGGNRYNNSERDGNRNYNRSSYNSGEGGEKRSGYGGDRRYDNRGNSGQGGGNRSYNNSGRDGNRGYNRNNSGEGGQGRGGYNNERHYNNNRGNNRRSESGGRQRGYGDRYPTYASRESDRSMRLNRYISMSGICSRREADDFIRAGVVSVNGVIVTEMGTKVNPGDVVRFNDEVLKNENKVYILMNKPKGYVTSLEDPHTDKTIMDLIKNACTERVYPVGRLDKSSMGVLLITNDGELTKRLTHPSHEKKKVYQVMLDKPLERADMDKIVEGIELEDGLIYADAVSYLSESKNDVGIEIHSGRNRIVRRIFEHLGYHVHKLDRVYFAGLTKKNLKRGQWRFLSRQEVEMLRSGMYE